MFTPSTTYYLLFGRNWSLFLFAFSLVFFFVTSASVPREKGSSHRVSSATYHLIHNKVKNLEVSYKKNNDLPPEQYFTQRLDHFNAQDRRTWKQRYFVNSTFWDGTGPIFLQIGGEGAISAGYVVFLQMANYAKVYGALMLALEHRFYGASQPFANLSTENLRYLSSQQALADAATFLAAMKNQFATNAPVVSFGCSYPGNLAAWFRLKFPTSTLASVASSAPVQATLDFFQYLDVVDKSLSYFAGEKCDQQIQTATNIIQNLLQSSSGRQKLQYMFNLCEPLLSDKDISTFMSNLMGNFMGVVQYNDENGNPVDISYLCSMMLNSSDALTAYIQISNLFLKAQGATCMDVSYKNVIQQLQDTSSVAAGVGMRQWTYQTCAEFGYFQTTDSPSDQQPFGNLVPVSYYVDMCKDAFGIEFDTAKRINETNIYYGGNELPKYGPTNILFVNGNVDSWHALSVTDTHSPFLSSILINGTAHCANVLPSSPNDIPSLVEARKKSLLKLVHGS